ncbi:PREDICTED: CD99 antigen [Sturnus vulgaris]|uniref:CD99 antigen n=1 Tax=Sturnus vulgaris TaxID=9172 RepID=UPI00071AA63C|nr:PREDICTED: CD99 antigen [Sturnus vulgaris]
MGHSLPSFPQRLCGLWHMYQRCTRTDSTKIGQQDGNWMKEHRLHIHPQQQVWFSVQLTPEFCGARSAHVVAHHVYTNLGTQHLKCVQTPACLLGAADQDQASRRGARCPKISPVLPGNQRCKHPSLRSPIRWLAGCTAGLRAEKHDEVPTPFSPQPRVKTELPGSACGSRSHPSPAAGRRGPGARRPERTGAVARPGAAARPGAVPPLQPLEQPWPCWERLSRSGWRVCRSVCELVGRAAMQRWRLLVLPVLLTVLLSVRGEDDFSLGDALLEDDFDLSHALGPDDPKPRPPANPRDTDNPKQDQPKGSDTFDDSDLLDGNFPKGGSDGSGSNDRKGPTPNDGQEEQASPGAIAGIISAVGAAVIGTVSSFIAYQKKKLCFKQSADEENVNMQSHRGAQSEPPVQRTLLEN